MCQCENCKYWYVEYMTNDIDNYWYKCRKNMKPKENQKHNCIEFKTRNESEVK